MSLLKNTIWKHITAAFGYLQSSTADVDTDIKRAYERTVSFNLAPSTNAVLNTTKRHVFRAYTNITVLAVHYVPDAAVELNATNYATMNVYKGNGAAAAATVVASANTSATNWAAGTPVALTLSSTAANLELDNGETLAADILKAGAGGVAVAQGSLCITYRER